MDKNYKRLIWQATTVFGPDDGQTEACMHAYRQAGRQAGTVA